MENLRFYLEKVAKKRKKFPLFNPILPKLKENKEVFLGLALLSLFLFFLSFSFSPYLREKSQRLEECQSGRDLFLSPTVFHRQYPGFGLIQSNSLAAFSPSYSADPEVLLTQTGFQERREIEEYLVQEGDTLSGIAEKFGISLNTVLWANDLSAGSVIQPGKKLIILPVTGAMHLVNSGDTLSQIAQDYEAGIEDILVFNEIKEEGEIYIGDILVIPGGEKPSRLQVYSVPLATSYFIFPCKGTITQLLHWYNAIDIGNKCGSPIFAAAEGTVQKTGWSGVGGYYVRIIHPNGVVTYYGHLSKILASPGQKVSQGNLIGYMGQTGQTTGCHLHFDVRGARNPLSGYSLGSYLSWN